MCIITPVTFRSCICLPREKIKRQLYEVIPYNFLFQSYLIWNYSKIVLWLLQKQGHHVLIQNTNKIKHVIFILCAFQCAEEPFNYSKKSFELWYTGCSYLEREVNYTFLTVTKINLFCKFSDKNTLQIVDKLNISEVSEELQYPLFRFPQRWYFNRQRR